MIRWKTTDPMLTVTNKRRSLMAEIAKARARHRKRKALYKCLQQLTTRQIRMEIRQLKKAAR
jgi:hypothetical protein